MKGWECPRCGRCYSPAVKRCPECSGGRLRRVERAPCPNCCRKCGRPKGNGGLPHHCEERGPLRAATSVSTPSAHVRMLPTLTVKKGA